MDKEQDQLLVPMSLIGAGGIAGRFFRRLRKMLRPDWPANLAMRVFDACWQNDFGHEQPTPEADFTVLPYGGLDLTKQIIRDQAGVFDARRDIDLELLSGEEDVITKDGSLKSAHPMAAVILENSSAIEAGLEATDDACDRNLPQINRRAMLKVKLTSFGGVGPAITTAASMYDYLRRIDPAVAGGREYSQLMVGIDVSFFESDPLFHRMQAMQAAYLRMWDIIGREGTATRDHRFRGGILPGFQGHLSGVSAGNERPFPPNPMLAYFLLAKDDMAGGRLSLDEAEEMWCLAMKYWASTPTFVSALLSRLGDAYRDVRGRQIAEGAYYRYGSFGLRAIELSAVEESRQLLLGKAIGEKALGQGDEEVALGFSLENISALRGSWERALADEGVVLPSENTLSSDMLTAPDPLTPIMREVEKVRQTMPHRLAQVLDSRSALDLDSLKVDLRQAIKAARERGSLRSVLASLESLGRSLDIEPTVLAQEGEWQTRLETLARQLNIAKPAASSQEARPSRFLGRLGWLIHEVQEARRAAKAQKAGLGARESRVENSITQEMRQIARDAARLILERGRLVRDNEIETLLAGIRSYIKEDVDIAIRDLRAQIDEIAAYVAEAETQAKSLYEQSREYSAICFRISLPLSSLSESLPVTAGMVEDTLFALASGQSVRQALAHGAPLAVDFVEMLLASDEARRFLARNASVEPQNRIDKRELGKARAVIRRFIVIPDDPRLDALLDSLKLPENIERHRVPGLKAVVCYSQIDALPARAFQTTRLCEKALDSLDPRNRKLVTLWMRYLCAPSKSSVNRLSSDQKVQVALMLTPYSTEDSGLALKLNGVSIFGDAEIHPFVEYHGQRFRIPGDVALSGKGGGKIMFKPVPGGMNVMVSEDFVVRHLGFDSRSVLSETTLKAKQPAFEEEDTGLHYAVPGEILLAGTTDKKIVFTREAGGTRIVLDEPFNQKLLDMGGTQLNDLDLPSGSAVVVADDRKAIFTSKNSGQVFTYDPQSPTAAAVMTGKAVLIRQSTGEQYHYWPHDRTLWQDDDHVWWIAFNISGGTRFERSLHTEDLVVAMDVIFQNDDFRQAIEDHLQLCVINLDVGAESLLKSALAPINTWLTTQRHLLEARDWDAIDDADKPEREVIEDLYPVIERLHEEITTFSGTRWTRVYRRARPENLIALRHTA